MNINFRVGEPTPTPWLDGPPLGKPIVVKVQVPLDRNDEAKLGSMALIYNKDRSHDCYITTTEALVVKMLDRKKVYFEAEITPEGLRLGKEVPNPGW